MRVAPEQHAVEIASNAADALRTLRLLLEAGDAGIGRPALRRLNTAVLTFERVLAIMQDRQAAALHRAALSKLVPAALAKLNVNDKVRIAR